MCSGREPGRTMVGMGAELTAGFVGEFCEKEKFLLFLHLTLAVWYSSWFK